MNLRALWIALLIALALAQPLRVRAGAANRVEPGELYEVAALWADGESHVHARRVACALEGAGIEGRDGLLGHPDAAEVVSPPVWEALRTTLVELRVDRNDELGRERFLAGLGPWLGALASFLAWLAARAAGAGVLESLLASAWLAVAPAAVAAGAWGRVGDVSLSLLALALGARFTVRALRAEEPLRAILGGMSSGAFAGLLLACSPAGLVPFAAGVLAYAVWALRTDGEHARFAARAGLLHSLVAAAVARMLVMDGPWQVAPGGALAAWVELASVLAFASAAPCMLAMVREHVAAKRVFPALVMLAAAVLIVLLVVRATGPLQQAWSAWSQARELRPLFESQEYSGLLLALTPLALLLPAGWTIWMRRPAQPADLYLFALSHGALLATLLDPALAPWCVLASALLLARVATGLGAGTRARKWGIGLVAGMLVAHAAAGLLAQPDRALRETRLEIARGLRWMRTHTPAPGPWNAPRAQADWGVLAVPARGAEVAWHARRPAVFSLAGSHAGVEAWKPVQRALQGEDLARAMRSLGARYLVVSPLDGQEPPAAEWGLVRVYASERLLGPGGRTQLDSSGDRSMPAISIWELPRPTGEDTGPQMRAR